MSVVYNFKKYPNYRAEDTINLKNLTWRAPGT